MAKTRVRPKRKAATNHLEAMKHDLRYAIWTILFERVASPKELAEELDADVSLVSHHAKRLVQLGCAELVDKRQVRGAVEHLYRATRQVLIDAEDWNQLLKEDPRLAEYIHAANMQLLLDDYMRSVRAGIFGADDRFLLDRTPVVVDAEGLDELIALFDRVEVEDVAAVVERSAKRRGDTGEDAVHVSVNLAIFQTPDRRRPPH